MALTVGKVTINTALTETKAITGFTTASYSTAYQSSVSPTISAGACNRPYFVQSTLASGATVTIDLRSLTEPVFGEALTPARAYTVHLKIITAPGRYMPGAANALVWPFNDASDAINLNAGDSFAYGSATAATIDATNRNVRIINTHGSVTLTYTIVFLLGV